ncbi:MAG: Transcriptional regulator, TrmB [Parcubacteria group bacterium GW2011_GWA2_49_9]|nr:MAG: Transcriptional regulator, TrmB [Parcubacteria group bacterium GW2011_GWA2_49_9]
MNEIDAKKALITYGMSERKSRIFLALVRRLEASATDLVKDTGIARATVYLDLQSLERDGFVSKSRKNGVAYFTAESLNKLVTKLREKEEVITHALPFIKNLSASAKQGVSIRLVKGKDGVQSIWEDILEAYKDGLREIYAFSNLDALNELLPRYFPDWLKKEVAEPVTVNLILPCNQKTVKDLPASPRRKIKYTPEDYAFPGEMSIYGDKVIFFYVDKKNPHAFIIESAEVAEMQKKVFLMVWNSIKEDRTLSTE